MAVNVLRALLEAQARSAWNRMRHESGLAGPLATLAVGALVAAIVGLPCLGMLWVGLDLGKDLAQTPRFSTLLKWNAWQALYTVVFAVLGSFQHRSSLTHAQVGRLPIAPAVLLLAELPAGLLQVFPVLGAAGIVCSNLGLAVRMPLASPWILLLTFQGLLAMLVLLFLTASLRRALGKRRLLGVVAGAGLLAVVLAVKVGALGLEELRWFFRVAVPAAMVWLPGSQGYTGLLDLRSGSPASGIGRLAAALGSTLALAGLTAWLHQRELAMEHTSSGFRRSPRLVFGRPASGIGRLFQIELLESHYGRATFLLPAILTSTVALVLGLVRYLGGQDGVLVEPLQRLERFDELPLFTVLLFLIVVADSQIWMNQFGWDRGGVRTLLRLPIPTRELLLGKLFGLVRFSGLQAFVAALPLLMVLTPTMSDVLVGLGAAGTALVAAAACGHVFSARFPRAVAREGSSAMPLYLSWVPSVLIVIVMLGLAGVHQVTKGLGPWGRSVTFLSVLGIAVGAYLMALPALGRRVHRVRERLLRM